MRDCLCHMDVALISVVVLSTPHNCNKTKINELYKTCRILAADLALLDILQIAKNWQPMTASRRLCCRVVPAQRL